MVQQNMYATRIKPASADLLTLRVVRREQISPHFSRVTLGEGDIGRFVPMGFDQWFRIFLPVGESGPDAMASLGRLPTRLSPLAYAKYLTISKSVRPVLRSYTVRGYRPEGPNGPELDVDFVLHGSAADGTSGPAATFAQRCRPGDPVALLDEGVGFHRRSDLRRVLLVADESGLPALAGTLNSLDRDLVGQAIIEVPEDADRQELNPPPGVKVHWVTRRDPHDVPGRAALAAVLGDPVTAKPDEHWYAWAVGESTLPVTLRRGWVAGGLPKANLMFCGYWRAGRAH